MVTLDKFRNDAHVIAINWFVNRCPLVTRVPRVPAGGPRSFATRGGGEQAVESWHASVSPAGLPWEPRGREPLDPDRMDGLQGLMDLMERSCYYGEPGPGRQRGLRLAVGSLIAEPKNAGAYKPTDLIRDTLEQCRLRGGDADVLIVSEDFAAGFAAWGQALQRIDAGVNVFGTPIDVFEAVFLGGVSAIIAPLLRAGTAVALTSAEVRLRMARNETWTPGEDGGGEWSAEGAIELDRPDHHAWVEGIRAFKAD